MDATLITAFGRILLFIVVWVVLSRRSGMQAKTPSGRNMLQLYELQLEEMKRNAALMERIAVALEKRDQR